MADRLLFLDPGALKFLLLLPVIVLLYMVRSRYRRRRISSTLLWRSVRRDLEARQRLRLPPLSLLMFLQLLAVAAGTAALMKPALSAQDRSHLVVLLDVSASMEATDVSPSRFAVAVQRAHQAIQQMQPGDQVSLVQVGSTPTLVASGTDRAETLAALDHLRPGAASADGAAALKLAESLLVATGGRGNVLLLSDGSFDASHRLPTLPVPVDFRSIGISGDNQGITTLEARQDLDGSGRWSAFARVGNYASQRAEMDATATADDLLLDTRSLNLAPGESSELSFALPPGTKSFGLTLNTHDIFPGDDRAEIRVDVPQLRKVLLVSKNAGPIERVFRTLPGLKVSTIAPDSYQSAEGADLVVLDNFVPATLPGADLLIMNPPAGAPGFVTNPAGNESPVLRSRRGSRLVDSVDLQSLRLGQRVRLQTPDWARSIVDGPVGPIVLQGDLAGRKIVLFNFDWNMYDLPRMQAFPLLLSNAVAELNPMALPDEVQPGDSVQLRPVADAKEATVEMPDGSHRQLDLSLGARSFGETSRTGRYTVTWKGSELGEISGRFEVNLNTPSASEIAPQQHAFGEVGPMNSFTVPSPGQQLWPALVVLLLVLLSLEWVYFTRRG